jgi:hypothetical protein
MGNSHEMEWAERRIAARPQEILAGLPNVPTNELDAVRQKLDAVQKELEQAKLLYNDLARENEALREAGKITPDLLKKYCDNARAYGWEAGKRDHSNLTGTGRLQAMYTSSRGNPFVDPDWDAHLKIEEGQGFIVTAKDNQL